MTFDMADDDELNPEHYSRISRLERLFDEMCKRQPQLIKDEVNALGRELFGIVNRQAQIFGLCMVLMLGAILVLYVWNWKNSDEWARRHEQLTTLIQSNTAAIRDMLDQHREVYYDLKSTQKELENIRDDTKR